MTAKYCSQALFDLEARGKNHNPISKPRITYFKVVGPSKSPMIAAECKWHAPLVRLLLWNFGYWVWLTSIFGASYSQTSGLTRHHPMQQSIHHREVRTKKGLHYRIRFIKSSTIFNTRKNNSASLQQSKISCGDHCPKDNKKQGNQWDRKEWKSLLWEAINTTVSPISREIVYLLRKTCWD